MAVALIILGGLIPLAVAYSLGKLCFRNVPDAIALGVGAAIESLLVFGLLAAGVARTPAFLALSILGLVPLVFSRPRFRMPAPGGLPAVIITVYGIVYFIHALAPEMQPDGMSYHLGLVAEYARLGGFPDRVAFFEMLPQGMEMLFLFAFAIGKHSSAKLVEFGFLLATIPLMLDLGRRMQLPDRVSGAAAAIYFCAPVVGITGTSTYTDAALVFFTLATLLALLLWKEAPGNRYLLAAGTLAGFCYAIKMSGLLVAVLATAFVASSRRFRPIVALAAAASISIAPWMIRNMLVTGNPLAPLANAIFPTQYFHLAMEKSLMADWRNYAGFTWRSAPYELTMGGKLQGNFGPLFLLLPLGLMALRQKVGRWTWLAALLLAMPWLSNAGARFLMPSLPFFALALAMSLDSLARPLLWVCLIIHAVTCEPSVVAKYRQAEAWNLPSFPFRAALRLESEHDYLTRSVWAYGLVDLLHQKTQPDERTFSLIGLPNAYIDRPVVDFWQSALADRIMDALTAADWRYDLRAGWPATPLQGLRFRLAEPHSGEWDLCEIRLFSDEDRVYNSPQWLLRAWPNPWEAPIAFDDNFASRWRTWGPMRPGMFVEVLFDRPQKLTAAELASHTPIYNVPVEFYGLGAAGDWKLLSRTPKPLLRSGIDPRRAATRYLKRSGIDYILAPTDSAGVWELGKRLVEQTQERGLEDVGQVGSVHLLRIVP